MRQRRPWLRHVVEVGLIAFIFTFIGLRLYVYEPVRVAEISMEPTLYEGDLLLINRLRPKHRMPPRGTLIVLHHPQNEDWVVKRVVAIAGDSIGFNRAGLWRNGQLIREPYAQPYGGEVIGPLRVPPDELYVAGDNRPSSEDSRDYGPVKRSLVIGEVVMMLKKGDRRRAVEAREGSQGQA